MSIFRVVPDGNKYRELDLEVMDFIDHFPEKYSLIDAHGFSRNNIVMSGIWQTMRTGFYGAENKDKQDPDITPWVSATLVLSPKAYRLLGDLLKPYGEFLPIYVEQELYQIFNCLTMVSVDESKSSDTHMEFNMKEIGDSVAFKTSFNNCLDTYCNHRLKDAVESFGLKGVIFDSHLGSFKS